MQFQVDFSSIVQVRISLIGKIGLPESGEKQMCRDVFSLVYLDYIRTTQQ